MGEPLESCPDSIDSISRGRLQREARSAGPQRRSRSRLFMTQTASIRRDAVRRNGAFQFEEKLLSRRIVLIDHKVPS
jgi:hypothetical protein